MGGYFQPSRSSHDLKATDMRSPLQSRKIIRNPIMGITSTTAQIEPSAAT